ncbi:MAG: hypothetical protein EOO27_50705 [Comamonadaceae bacterium]|nr:MAG: hypothetical protein EOO27_50705 [Comamonadaceae bacterium]
MTRSAQPRRCLSSPDKGDGAIVLTPLRSVSREREQPSKTTKLESRLARRWAARRLAGFGSPLADTAAISDEVVLEGAMLLLSNYEDAIYTMHRRLMPDACASRFSR